MSAEEVYSCLTDVGPGTDLFTESVDTIVTEIENIPTIQSDYLQWKEFLRDYLGLIESVEGEETLTHNLENDRKYSNIRFLYGCRIYCGFIVEALAEKIGIGNQLNSLTTDVALHQWLFEKTDLLKEVRENISSEFTSIPVPNRDKTKDPIRDIVASIIPSKVRHTLGAVYTPDWLVSKALNDLDPDLKGHSFLEPACGTGVYLIHLMEKIANKGEIDPDDILDRLVGVEINPMDTILARFNYLWALHEIAPETMIDFIPVYNTDFVLGLKNVSKYGQQTLGSFTDSEHEFIYPSSSFELKTGEAVNQDQSPSKVELTFARNQVSLWESSDFDYIVGNPPWVSWDSHGKQYRDALAMRWKDEELFTQSGWRSKVAAGKTDLSALFVYEAMDGYLSKGGEISFILPVNLFKNPSGGEGFRRFKTKDGVEFAPKLIEDLNGCAAFKNRSTAPCIAVFKRDQIADYPVRYLLWKRKNGSTSPGDLSSFEVVEHVAEPVGEEKTSSWINGQPEFIRACKKFVGGNSYRARSGVNTGGGNAAYHLKILGEKNDTYEVVNHSPRARKDPGTQQQEIEKPLVHPLLKGADIEQFDYTPSQYIFFPYERNSPKKPIPEDELKEKYPKAYKFVCGFEEFLKERSEFGRWGGGEYYKLFRIGPYTFADYKVAWRHTGIGNGMRSCVLEDPEVVPDQKAIIVPFRDFDEAHYFCGILNSDFLGTVLNAYLMLDASPGILDTIHIPKWEGSASQMSLSKLSQSFHRKDEVTEDDRLELNNLVADIYELTDEEKGVLLAD